MSWQKKREARARAAVSGGGARLTDQLDLRGCCYRAELEKGDSRVIKNTDDSS